jgi:hypothetical protein
MLLHLMISSEEFSTKFANKSKLKCALLPSKIIL